MTSLSSLLLPVQEAKANATAAICAAKRLPETKDELFKEVAPFWESFGYDKEHGGFICGLQHDGSVSDDSKFSWYQGRGAWVFSKLYKMTGSEKFLKMAKGALLFTLNHCSVYGKDAQQPQTLASPSIPVQMYTMVGRSGEKLEGRTETDKVGYTFCFLAEGLQEYASCISDAAEKRGILEKAIGLVKVFVDRANDPERNAPETYLLSLPYQKGTRALGHSMIPLRFSTQCLRTFSGSDLTDSQSKYLEGLAKQSVENITVKHVDQDFGIIREELSHTWEPLNSPTLFYLGHAMESLWMVMDEGSRVGNQGLIEGAAVLFQRHAEVAWDNLCGGCIRGITLEQNHNDKFMNDKVAWVQQEALSGCLVLIELSHQPELIQWAAEYFCKLCEWTFDRFPLKRHAHKTDKPMHLWLVGGDRQASFKENYTFGDAGLKSRKENYHHPRMLMMFIESFTALTSGMGDD